MSKASQILLGVVFAGSALFFVWFGLANGAMMPNGAVPFYGLAAFCGVVALACLVQGSRPVALRIIGAVICLTFVCYAVAVVGGKDFYRALAGCFVIGLPCGYLAVTGRYPYWGQAGAVFGSDSDERESDDGDEDADDG